MKKELKAGRPKLPKGEAKSATVRARVSPAELKRLEAAAVTAGMKLSDWTRKTLLAAT